MQSLSVENDIVIVLDYLPEDEANKWRISEQIEQTLTALKVPVFVHRCPTKASFTQSLRDLIPVTQVMNFFLHLVGHGGEKGLWIKSEKVRVEWAELGQILKEINHGLSGQLVINLTSCFGLHAAKTNRDFKDGLSSFGFIGSPRSLTVRDSTFANKLFYESLASELTIPQAISAVNDEWKKSSKSDLLQVIPSESFQLFDEIFGPTESDG